MKILVSIPKGKIRDVFFPSDAVCKLQALGNVEWNNTENHFDNAEFKKKLKNVDICITGWGTQKLDRDILDGADKLAIVFHVGGTVAGVVSDYLYEKGIKIISGNMIFAESVAEGVLAYILCSLRQIPFYASQMQKGVWKELDSPSEGLLDQTVGLVGFGAIARCLVKMLIPFRTKIKVYDPYVTKETFEGYGILPASLEEIFSTSKIISIHAPKKPDTFHMINRKLLSKINDGALLINTARGSVVDESALIEELKKRRFKAVLDVYEREPLPIDSELIGLDNVILIPHMAVSLDRYMLVSITLIEDVVSYYENGSLKYEITKSYAENMTR